MADEEQKQPEEHTTTNDEDVVVTEKKGEDPASSPKPNGKTFYDMVTGLYQAPFLGLVEEHLWRTRDSHDRERYQCLHHFKKSCPRLYTAVLVADLLILTFLLVVILSVIAVAAYVAVSGLFKL